MVRIQCFYYGGLGSIPGWGTILHAMRSADSIQGMENVNIDKTKSSFF